MPSQGKGKILFAMLSQKKYKYLPKPIRCIEMCVYYNKVNMRMNLSWFQWYIFSITAAIAAKIVEIFRGSGKKYEW